jgi:uncharacterized protein (TIGR02145 family)
MIRKFEEDGFEYPTAFMKGFDPSNRGTSKADSFDYVIIGNQKWMTKNLELPPVSGTLDFVDTTYGTGRYYTYQQAIDIANSIEGWHLPSQAEWQELFNFAAPTDSSKLRAATLWNSSYPIGTDDYGFAAVPTGRVDGGAFSWQSGSVGFYQASDHSVVSPNGRVVSIINIGTAFSEFDVMTGLVIRLIKD